MHKRTVTVKNPTGIHARPAALIVQTASQYSSKIDLHNSEGAVNAKSIMGIITLGATQNEEIVITAEGTDEKQAIEAIELLFTNGFEEAYT